MGTKYYIIERIKIACIFILTRAVDKMNELIQIDLKICYFKNIF